MNRREFLKKSLEGIVLGSIPLISGCSQKNPIIYTGPISGMEYYMQTDKTVYKLGKKVEMLYRITNTRDESVKFIFPHTPLHNFWIEKDGEVIWRAVNSWLDEMTLLMLAPDDSDDYSYVWDMKDTENILVDAGQYNAIGGLYAGTGDYADTKVSVPIEIIP